VKVERYLKALIFTMDTLHLSPPLPSFSPISF
jgi:hypothetical protein